jgi:hypothetical protein
MVIYQIENLINGKKYIGRDSLNRPGYLGGGTAIKNAIKKYGRKDKGLGTLVNMTDGGDGSLGNKGVKRTEKTKQNLKLSQPNRKKIIATKDGVSQIYESINELIKELFNLIIKSS